MRAGWALAYREGYMGEHEVSEQTGDIELRGFMRAILADVLALEQVIERGMIEKGVRRIGAEQ